MKVPMYWAELDNGVVLEWYPPQVFSRVFKAFKLWCDMENVQGKLYAAGQLIRVSGRKGEQSC